LLKRHHLAGRIQKAKWTTLEVRAAEVKATDLEDDLDALTAPEEPAKAVA
jgi:hypothetical protein